MGAKNLNDGTSSGKGSVELGQEEKRVSPDYQAWEGLGETSTAVAARVIGVLGQRPIPEVAIVLAQLGLILLARDVIKTRGAGMPSPQGFICIIFLSVMIWTPALYHIYPLVVRNRNNAENREGSKNSSQLGDERAGASETREPTRQD